MTEPLFWNFEIKSSERPQDVADIRLFEQETKHLHSLCLCFSVCLFDLWFNPQTTS
jgi:hypothetical protein